MYESTQSYKEVINKIKFISTLRHYHYVYRLQGLCAPVLVGVEQGDLLVLHLEGEPLRVLDALWPGPGRRQGQRVAKKAIRVEQQVVLVVDHDAPHPHAGHVQVHTKLT